MTHLGRSLVILVHYGYPIERGNSSMWVIMVEMGRNVTCLDRLTDGNSSYCYITRYPMDCDTLNPWKRSWISAIAWDPFVESASVNIDSRLGSVGQDGILCFWELANDVMFPRRTR